MMSDSHSHGHGDSARTTLSTRVGPERLSYVATHCDHTQQSKAAFLRYLIRLHEASMEGELRCDHCDGAVRLEE